VKTITPERWPRIEELYHAALERAPADRAALSTMFAEPIRNCGAKWNQWTGSRQYILLILFDF